MKRFDHNCYSMDEKTDGDWVEYEDAAELQRQLAEARTQLREMTGLLVEKVELQRQLAETKAALADLLQQIEACDGTAQLNIECAQKLINEDLK